MAAPRSPSSSRKIEFLILQVLVAASAVALLVPAALQFVATSGGDPTPLFISAILILLSATLMYTTITLRTRGSSPYFATVVANFVALLILASLGASGPPQVPAEALLVAALVALVILRNRFHLRPGEVVKEEHLAPDVAAKVSTKLRGVRCRECGDDDVWITSDKLLVCKNCGSTAA